MKSMGTKSNIFEQLLSAPGLRCESEKISEVASVPEERLGQIRWNFIGGSSGA
jgi:hypothetical protein